MRPKAVTDLKNSLYYPLVYNLYTETRMNSLIKLFLSDQTQESALATPIFCRQKQSFAYVFQMGDLKKWTIFKGKHLCWSLFLITLQAKACNFIKKGLRHSTENAAIRKSRILEFWEAFLFSFFYYFDMFSILRKIFKC